MKFTIQVHEKCESYLYEATAVSFIIEMQINHAYKDLFKREMHSHSILGPS